MSGLRMTTAAETDWDDILVADARAFGMTTPVEEAARQEFSALLSGDAMRVVRDTGMPSAPLVGVGAYYRMQITPPGGAPTRAAGLTWVSVAATHRRQGILRMMLADLTAQWVAEGYPFAILTATEATIYERFGFGVAMFVDRVSIPTGTSWRAADTTGGTTHYATTEQAAQMIPAIHTRWAAQHPGAITRAPQWWAPIFADRPSERETGETQQFYLLHADGYAIYRLKRTGGIPDADVIESVAITDEAHTALWRVLTNLDRTGSVHCDLVDDDPLPLKLNDFRAIRHTAQHDTVWVYLLDVAAALTARRYRADATVVIDIEEGFGSTGERIALTVRDGAASATPSDAAPDVALSLPTLGSLYFGGWRATDLARGGRIVGDAEAIAHLDAAFATERLPVSGTFF